MGHFINGGMYYVYGAEDRQSSDDLWAEAHPVFVVVCAWCQTVISKRYDLGKGGVSHGLCQSCREIEEKKIGGIR